MESEVRELLGEELKDAYSAEKQALRCMQKTLKMASAGALREGIQLHIDQTQTQIERIEQAMEKLEIRPGRKVCEAMSGLVAEAQHDISEQDGKGPILNLVIVAGMQRIEHYEIAAYGKDIALAKALGEQQVGGYGAGAIMGVPAHDARDHAFARTLSLPIIPVVTGADVTDVAWEGDGTLVNSGFLDGMTVAEAKRTMFAFLTKIGAGRAKTTYRLRDWLFSRQRYWGEPIPILHLSAGRVVPLPEDSLPLLPPELENYTPAPGGEPPLARATEWLRTTDPRTGEPALLETNTMPQWAGSCWYYLRFLDPHNQQVLVDPAAEKYWMPVDLYVGGAEHAVLHLLYSRFWHKVLYDIGVVSTPEPFAKLFNQGMILAFSYRDDAGRYYKPDDVVERDGGHYAGDKVLTRQLEKMSKSRFNVVNPDDVVEQYGADSVRLYEMFMGPLDVAKPWQMSGVTGVRRFLDRAWRIVCGNDDELNPMVQDGMPASTILLRLRHQTVASVTGDIEALRFHTVVARLMEMANGLTVASVRPREVVETFVKLLAPFAPHLAEELWSKLGHEGTLAYASWPSFDPAIAQHDTQEYVVQVNGKVRHRFEGATGLDGAALLAAAKADSAVIALLDGRTVVKEIAIPGRLVNFVV